MRRSFRLWSLAPEAWTRLRTLTAGSPLLPNLQELICSWTSPESTAQILLTIASTLRLLDIRLPCSFPHEEDRRAVWDASYQMFLSSAFSIAPNLTTLHLPAHKKSAEVLCSSIAHLQHLRVLVFSSMDTISVAALRALSTLPALKRICLGRIAWTAPVDPPIAEFHSLEELEIVSHLQVSSYNFSEIFSSSRLRSIYIRSYSWDLLPWSFQRTCDMWAHRFPSLTSLSCCLSTFVEGVASAQPISQIIKPLFKTQTITHVTLYPLWTGYFTVSEEDLSQIATAWPRLTTLELGSDRVIRRVVPIVEAHSGSLSAGALSIIAALCPLLQTLQLGYVQMSDPALADAEQQASAASEHRLERLCIDQLAIDAADIPRVARLVDRLFPDLLSLSEREREMMEGEMWTLWDAVDACQVARRRPGRGLPGLLGMYWRTFNSVAVGR